MSEFKYSNTPEQPSGWLIRVAAFFIPGIRRVQKQIVPYARAWQQQNQQAMQQREPLWVVLGDSMGQGIGASAYDKGWVGQLDSLLKSHGKQYRIVNLSVSGAKTRDVLQRQLPLLRSLGTAPDLVTVTVGSNDRGSSKNRQQLVADFNELLRQLPRGTVVASILSNFAEVKQVDRDLRTAVSADIVRLADVRNDVPSWRGKLSEDRYHPNDAGYAAMADSFFRAIQKD